MHNKTFLSSIFTPGIIAVLYCLFLLAPAHAGVYKWTDENGQVHYGERPGNTDAEKVTIRQNETTKPRVIETDAEKKPQQTEKPAEPEKTKISKKKQRKYCNEAKHDLANINSRGLMREINAKGEYVYMSEKQRQQRISAAKKKKRTFCN